MRSDTDLFKLFEGIDFAHTVMVIEDIDCASEVVKTRDSPSEVVVIQKPDSEEESEKPEEKPRLTLAGILNAIDGAMLNVHGQILIMTTNHPEVLDPALTRAGRVDRKFEFELCDAEQARNLFINFFGTEAAEGKKIPGAWPTTGPKCPADVTGVLIQHRMDSDEAWNELVAL